MERDRIVRALRDRFPGLIAIHAFGSRVRGEHRPDSDLDLAILVPGHADPLALWEAAGELGRLIDQEVDLLDLRAASTVMQHQILTGGERWWARPGIQADLFEAAMLSEKTALDEARKGLLEDIRESGRIHGR